MADLLAPDRRLSVEPGRSTPPQKTKPSTMISTNIEGLRTDDEVRGFLRKHKGEKTALIKFGSSWCYHCQEVFPQFLKLTKQFPSVQYAVAQIDYLTDVAKHVEYTPTFTFYKDGKPVDQLFGMDMEKLSDRLWLHHD